jgi:hypothetical protein
MQITQRLAAAGFRTWHSAVQTKRSGRLVTYKALLAMKRAAVAASLAGWRSRVQSAKSGRVLANKLLARINNGCAAAAIAGWRSRVGWCRLTLQIHVESAWNQALENKT